MTDVVYMSTAVKHTDALQTKWGREGSESSGSELKEEKVFFLKQKKQNTLGFCLKGREVDREVDGRQI